jgi:hypothetical protein
MPKEIKYFEVNGEGLHSPVYYAAYSKRDAAFVAYDDLDIDFLLEFAEVALKEIPLDTYIFSAKLEFADSKEIAARNLSSIQE